MKRKKVCSYCNSYFRDWKNQESEGAACGVCTFGILRKEVKEFHKVIRLMADNLNERNRRKLLGFPFYIQRYIVWEAIRDGIITFSISSRYSQSFGISSIGGYGRRKKE